MPTIEVDGVSVAYELAGDGTPVVYTPAGWFARDTYHYALSGRLSVNHTVMLWDRPNSSGASDVALRDAPSEWHYLTDVLHAMLSELGLGQAYFWGASGGGCTLSLLMAHQYPADVKGLVLDNPPTDDITQLRPIAEGHFLYLSTMADSSGMKGVVEASEDPESPYFAKWVAETIAKNPENRDRFLSMDVNEFTHYMRRSLQWCLTGKLHLANLSDNEIRAIEVPALVSAGSSTVHPEHTARELYTLLSNSELVDYSSLYSPQQIEEVEDLGFSAPSTLVAFEAPFYESFLLRVESGSFVADRK